MASTVSRIHKRKALLGLLGSVAVAAVLGASASRAQASEVTATPDAITTRVPAEAVTDGFRPFADRFPNVVLRTHEGRNVHFYDDLLKDKIVLINFMYATCTER